MSAIEKLLQSIISGTQDNNIKFKDLQKLLSVMGFDCRIKGDHFIYYYNDLPEILNLQPVRNLAKPYQVKQVRNFILKYGLTI